MLKRANEITEVQSVVVYNRMKGIELLHMIQMITDELSDVSTEDQFLEWIEKNASKHAMESLKAVETFYLEGIHPSLNVLEVTLAVLRDFRGEILAA